MCWYDRTMGSGGRLLCIFAVAPCVACSASTAPWTGEGTPSKAVNEPEELEIENKPDEPLVCPTDPPGVCSPGTSIDCYEGPPGTFGAGSCAAGKQHCNAHGSAYGSCEYQVLPNPYDCTNPTAFSCDAKLRACGLLQQAEVRPATVKRIAFDGSNGFIFGSYTGSALLLEHSVDAQTIWSTAFDISSEMPARMLRSIAVDGQGASIVAVSLDDEEDSLVAGSNIQGPAAVVLKLDPNGALEWTRVFAANGLDVHAVAIGTSANDIWLGGSFAGGFDFGTGLLQAPAGTSDGFLLRLDTFGTTLWSRALGSLNSASFFSVAVDRNGYAFAGGKDNPSGSCSPTSALLASYDPAGQLLWKRLFTSALTSPSISSIAIDSGGAIYVSGRIESIGGGPEPISPPWAIDLGGGPVTGSMFVARYDAANGDLIWSRTASDSNTLSNLGGYVALDPSGNLMWAAQNNYAPRIRAYDPNGHQLWERLLPTIGPEPEVHDGGTVVYSFGVHGFAVQPSGRFAIVGDFDGTIDFGEGPVDNTDGGGFLAVYDL